MLGEKIGEARGKITGTRVLETHPTVKVETSFEAKGTLVGLEANEIGTYWSVMDSNGVLYGEGNGIVMTPEGPASWKGSGTARSKGGRAASFRGAIFYQTQVERLRSLNGIAVVFEFDVDDNGNTQAKIFEWK